MKTFIIFFALAARCFGQDAFTFQDQAWLGTVASKGGSSGGDIVAGLDLDMYFNGNITDQQGKSTASFGSVTYASGQSGVANGSVVLDGSSSTFYLTDFTVGNYGSGSYTISFWVNPTSLANNPCLFFKGPFQVAGYYMQIGSDGSGFFAVESSGSSTVVCSLTAGQLVTGSWQHVSIIKSGGGGAATYTLYINSVQINRTTGQPDAADSSSLFDIGSYNFGTSLYFSGKYDDFRLYNRALSAGEESTLTTNGAK